MIQIIFAILLALFAGFARQIVGENVKGIVVTGIRTGCGLLALFLICSTSYVVIDSDKVGHIKRIYMGSSMPAGQIIALAGEQGPQAEILPPGFNFRFFLNVLNDVEEKSVVVINNGEYGYLVAKDGIPLKKGHFMASAWPEESKMQMMNADYFLTNGGQKGPQLTVLTPGTYRINRYLFDISAGKATDIPAGFVGVVKSNVQETPKLELAKVSNKDLAGSLSVPLVKEGSVGIWVNPMQPGRYYLNTVAYNITPVDTRVQTWSYKGGYTKRFIDLKVTQDGQIEQKERSEVVAVPADAADSAINTKMEGWTIPQEIRIQVQVEAKDAPFLVASVGTVSAAENKVVTPSIRSVVRNICAGEKVLSMINENRSIVEGKIETKVTPEGRKAGVTIKDVRLVDSVIPPEMLVARLREQLANQLKTTFEKEKQAQDQRIATEQARATAEQQPELVKSEMAIKIADNMKLAAKKVGEGEKLKLIEIAKGQKAQVSVLGADRTMELAVLDKILASAVQNPDIVKVPATLVAGNGSSLEGAAAILGNSNIARMFQGGGTDNKAALAAMRNSR